MLKVATQALSNLSAKTYISDDVPWGGEVWNFIYFNLFLIFAQDQMVKLELLSHNVFSIFE